MEMLNVCLINDSFPPAIDGVANAVTNYARIIARDYGSPTVVTPGTPTRMIRCMTSRSSATPAST